MRFKIFKNANIIQGISDASFGSMRNGKNAVKFLRRISPKSYEVEPRKIVWAQQVFGANVHVCKPEDSEKVIRNVDGLISDIPGQILAIITADCVPILLYDEENRVVAALHGSRKSLIKGIIKNAIQKMKSHFGSNPEKILVAIGPHIRICHYWLKEEAYQELKNTKFQKYFVNKKTHHLLRDRAKGGTGIHFDLTGLVFDELKRFGISRGNIEDCEICTFCRWQKYFSARKKEECPKVYKEKNPVFSSFIGLESPQIQRLKTNISRKDVAILAERVVEILKAGGAVIFPTDTVYGLGCNALDEKAVKKIFRIKKRPATKALPIFVKDLKMAKKLAYINKRQEEFLKKVWPGQITVVLKKKKFTPKILCGKTNSIGLRIPKHKFIQKLLAKVNFPIVGTSANISGRPASGRIKEVLDQFKGQKFQSDLVINAGNLPKAKPSAVVDLTGKKIKILRK